MKKTWMSAALAIALATTASAAGTAHADDPYGAEWHCAWNIYTLEAAIPFDLRSQVAVDLPVTINAPIAKVWSVYSNLNNDIGRHPFLKAIYVHSDTAQNGVETEDFTALEDIPLTGTGSGGSGSSSLSSGVSSTMTGSAGGGPVFPGHTHAQQKKYPAQYYYTSDSWDLPNITTHQVINFQDNGNGTTTVVEHIRFLANPLLIDFTVSGGVSSHQAYQAALKRDIENGTL